MRSDLFLFIGILVFLFVVWVASGGPHRPLSFAGPTIAPLPTTGTGGGSQDASLSRGPAQPVATPRQVATNLSKAEQGILKLENVVFTVSVTYFFLLASTKTLEARRWR